MTNNTTRAAGSFANLLAALDFAAEKHRGQRRKDAEASPYINHPVAVARLLAEVAGIDDVEVLQAAVLHDTLEDTRTTPEELRSLFGERVTSIVLEVTDDKRLPKEQRKQLQVDHAPHKSRDAAIVKMADKTCNLRDVVASPPAEWPIERKREYFDWAKRVVDALPKVNDALEREFQRAYTARP